jgi:BolA protein
MTEMREQLRSALEKELSPLSLEIVDDSARHAGHAGAREGGHFTIEVVSRAFTGRPQLERHRLVYAAVAPLMGRGVHALSIQAHSPEEVS